MPIPAPPRPPPAGADLWKIFDRLMEMVAWLELAVLTIYTEQHRIAAQQETRMSQLSEQMEGLSTDLDALGTAIDTQIQQLVLANSNGNQAEFDVAVRGLQAIRTRVGNMKTSLTADDAPVEETGPGQPVSQAKLNAENEAAKQAAASDAEKADRERSEKEQARNKR